MLLDGLPAFTPDWALPNGVRALQTECGIDQQPAQPFGSFNLGDHVGDVPARVDAQRRRLATVTGTMPVWLNQVHGTTVVEIEHIAPEARPEADAVMTQHRGRACAIMTADCLPVLVADRQARVVGAAHAGWRGLAAGVLQALVAAMTRVPGVTPGDLSVWLGPAIGPTAFEVGQDVLNAFTHLDAGNRVRFSPQPHTHGKYLADLPGLASDILGRAGVKDITASGLCTVSLPDRFYSYRRSPQTGRMASLIWLD